MKITKALALIMAAAGLLAFALPAQAQSNRHGGGNSSGGGMHHNGGGHDITVGGTTIPVGITAAAAG